MPRWARGIAASGGGAPPAQAMEISIPDVRRVPADRLERQRQNMERFRAEAKARKAAEKARGKSGRAGGRAAAVDATAVPVRPQPTQMVLKFQHVQYGTISGLTFSKRSHFMLETRHRCAQAPSAGKQPLKQRMGGDSRMAAEVPCLRASGKCYAG